MQIFLSYASEDRDTAEQVQLALVADGHQIFFDRESLPPAGDYQSRIRAAVGRSDYFIFLIAPESVSKGSFALTELRYAREKWKHPKDRVLPVVVRSVPWESIPTYLKAVTILEPVGNIAADITSAAADSTHRWGTAANAFAGAVRKTKAGFTHDTTRTALRLLLTLSVLLIGLFLAGLTGNGAHNSGASGKLANFVTFIVCAAAIVVTFHTWRNFGTGTIRRLLASFGIFVGGLFLGLLVSDGKGEDELTVLLTVWTAALVAAVVTWRRIK